MVRRPFPTSGLPLPSGVRSRTPARTDLARLCSGKSPSASPRTPSSPLRAHCSGWAQTSLLLSLALRSKDSLPPSSLPQKDKRVEVSVRKALEVSKAPYRIFDLVGPVPSTASSYAVPYLSLDETRLATRSAYFGAICYNANISLSRAAFFAATGLFALSVSGDGKPLLRAGTPCASSFFQD